MGAVARPRRLESVTYQVILAYVFEGATRRFVPGSLRVQRVVSKNATYNARILETMATPTCALTTDQGGEWARLRRPGP
eukprot:3289673-Lingulodinium_polyedra.AAC.1